MSRRRSTRSHAQPQAKQTRYEESEEQYYVTPIIDGPSTSSYGMSGNRQAGHSENYGHTSDLFQHHNTDMPQSEEVAGPSSGRSLRSRGILGAKTVKRSTSIPMSRLSLSQTRNEPEDVDSAGEVGDDDDDGDIEGCAVPNKPKKSNADSVLSVDDMVQNCLYCFLLVQHKKTPIKRSDLIKVAMNSQSRSFLEVIKKVTFVLEDIFGMKVVCLDRGKDNVPFVIDNPFRDEDNEVELDSAKRAKGKGTSGLSYIMTSKFPSSICDCVKPRDPEVDSKKTVLYLILCVIFMMNRPVDENGIWQIIIDMKLDQMVCKKRENLRKFLKSEFVTTCYLNMDLGEPINPNRAKGSNFSKEPVVNPGDSSQGGDQIPAKYTWGPRADIEYSKGHMLNFVASRFPGRQTYEFTVQYNEVKKLEPDFAEKGQTQANNIVMDLDADDDDNTETETECVD